MKRRAFIIAVNVLALTAFVGAGICADANKPGQGQNISMMEKIKNAYNNWQEKRAAGKSPAPVTVNKEQPAKPKVLATTTVRAELTKEEMVADIKEGIDIYEEEITDSVNGLKVEKDKEGKLSFTYNGVKLEDMSKEALRPLFQKVRQLAVRLRTDRIQRQLDIVRQAQSIRKPPPVPPAVPHVPAAPPSAPKQPAPPPAPPSTRR